MLAGNIVPSNVDFRHSTKEQLVALLASNIRNRAKYAFKYFPSRVFSSLLMLRLSSNKLVQRIFHADTSMFNSEDTESIAENYLTENGFCFAFLPKGKTEVQYIIPSDLGIDPEDVLRFLGNGKADAGSLNAFFNCARIVSSLYGICPADVFMELYNRDAELKIKDKKRFLQCMEEAASLTGDYYFIDNSLVSDFIDYDTESSFILERRAKFKPYIPPLGELQKKRMLRFYDDDNKAYEQLIRWCSEFLHDKDEAVEAADMLRAYIKIGYPLTEALKMLQTNKETFLRISMEDGKRFFRIISDLNNSCRLWTRWGHCPNELYNLKLQSEFDSVLTQEAIDERRRKRNSHHLELPADCRKPSNEECKEQVALLNAYWQAEDPPLWHEQGLAAQKRIFPSFKKLADIFAEMPEDAMPKLLDQWLASLWHKSANRGGRFGDVQWNYHVFEPVEKIGENLFSCIDSDGSIFVVYSPSVGTQFEEVITCMSVLIDAGGWFLTYGPVLGWNGLMRSDFLYLAQRIAPQTYKQQGFTAVMHFNPCPFWAVFREAKMTPVLHKGELVTECSLECTFINNTVPELLNAWSAEHAGKYTRWVYNKEDYLNSRTVYLNHKTNEVFLAAHNETAFEKMLSQLKKYIKAGKSGSEKVSFVMQSFCNDFFKKPQKLLQLEAKFFTFLDL